MSTSTKVVLQRAWLGVWFLAVGCVASEPPLPAGNAALGIASFALEESAASYTTGEWPGTFVMDCTDMATCSPPGAVVANSCGRGAPAIDALRVSLTASPYTEDLIAQCCIFAGTTTMRFAIKTCPTSGDPVGQMSTCGEVPSGACKACSESPYFYPQPADMLCNTWFREDELRFCYSADGGAPATQLAQLSVPQLWPPDGRQVTIDLAGCIESITDPCEPALTADEVVNDPSFDITYLGSDEPAAERGASPGSDIARSGEHSVTLRRARDGGGDGRVYHVGIAYRNPNGLTTTLDCRYGVRHDDDHPAAVDSWSEPAGSPANPGFVIADP